MQKKIIIIIQARMTSTRLPGKVLLPIGEKPALQVLVERLSKFKNHIIIATTDDATAEPIVDLCKNLNINCFRGDTENVLQRYYLAAKSVGAKATDGIIRITSDNPLIDVDLVSKVIGIYQKNTCDMVSLGPHSGFPRGLDCCLFSFETLEKTYLGATQDCDKEHVSLGMAKFIDLTCYNVSAYEDLSHIRLTMDEEADYETINGIYEAMNHRTDFSYQELINLLTKQPQLLELNKHVKQK